MKTATVLVGIFALLVALGMAQNGYDALTKRPSPIRATPAPAPSASPRPAPAPLTKDQQEDERHAAQLRALDSAQADEDFKKANIATNERCRNDVACYSKPYMSQAEVGCRKDIERQAKYQFEWTEGWLGSKFNAVIWARPESGTFALTGRSIKMQNGFGAWRPMSYFCVFDPSSGVASAVVSE